MRGKSTFSSDDANRIRALLAKKVCTESSGQKAVRDDIRSIGFYIKDFHHIARPFGPQHFDELVASGQVKILDNASVRVPQGLLASASTPTPTQSPSPAPARAKAASDESYVIDICDEVLGQKAERQKRFSFLVGDSGTPLPADAYYPHFKLVVEYRERQHTESVALFDKRQTCSGVDRGTQRRMYDQRRRDVLPKHDIALVELSFDMFDHDGRKRLRRNRVVDFAVGRKALARWMGQ